MIRVFTSLQDVPEEVYDWLDEYVVDRYWTSHSAYNNGTPGRVFFFDDSSQAMLFKLTWGGV